MGDETKVEAPGEEIGKIMHYYTKLGVGILELNKDLKKGEKIRIKGATTDFEQTIDSMQVEHKNIETAKAGDAVGLKTAGKVSEGSLVYKVE